MAAVSNSFVSNLFISLPPIGRKIIVTIAETLKYNVKLPCQRQYLLKQVLKIIQLHYLFLYRGQPLYKVRLKRAMRNEVFSLLFPSFSLSKSLLLFCCITAFDRQFNPRDKSRFI